MPNSIYSAFDSRLNNPMFNQQTGAFGQQPATTTGTTSPTSAMPLASGAQPNLSSLTQLVNTLNLQGQQSANAGRVPGSAGLEAQSSANIGNELGGRLPSDVVTQLQQQAAERGVAMGSPGSDNSNSSLLRALGLNSLNLQQQGQRDLSAADARNPGAQVFDPTSQLLTPYQAGNLNNQGAELALQWYKALNPGVGGGGGGRGGGQPPALQTDPTQQNWFKNLMGGTPAMPSAPPPTADPTGALNYSLGFNPSAPLTDLPDLGSPNTFDAFQQNPGGTDFWSDPSTVDQFAGYA